MPKDETEGRPNPEELLANIKEAELQSEKGHLKIFLGMAAGVGKTYSMLKEAHRLKELGVDVVVGIIDTHGRPETALLLEGLKIIPEKEMDYKGRLFKELDLERILTIHPECVLIDELAHNNVPGAKHAKRWQDVQELLDNGINVYTTLNVQHIESLNDIVRSITEVNVRETVPDLLIEKADSIRLVDLTPEELLQRLVEGKVYLGEQSQVAIDHFFQINRLTALREVVLRFVADKVDLDLQKMLPVKEGVIEWRPREKLLVAVSSSPHSQKLIRTARRLAATMDASWLAVHVNDGRELSQQESEQLARNIRLARDLGAELVSVSDPKIAQGIKRVATQRGVTQIILGRPPKNPILGFFSAKSLLETLAEECKDIDIHVIRQEKHAAYFTRRSFAIPSLKRGWDYLAATLWIIFLTVINLFLVPFIGVEVVGIVYFLGILGLSLFFNKGPILFGAVLSALVWDLGFISPEGSVIMARHEDAALLALYLLTAITTGILVERAFEHRELLAKSEMTTLALYEIVHTLSGNITQEEAFAFVKEHLNKSLSGFYELLIKRMDDGLILKDPEHLLTTEHEHSAAIWCFENGKEAGWSSDTLPSAQNLYIPLKGLHEMVGVLVFRSKSGRFPTVEEKQFIYVVCQQVAAFIERGFAAEKSKQHDQLKQLEKIHRTILYRFSKAFEAPIEKMKRALEHFHAPLMKKSLPEIAELESSFQSMQEIVLNVGSMAQLSEGMVPLRKELHDLREFIHACCLNEDKIAEGHPIDIITEEALPPISFDYCLLQILFHNLFLNAVEHSPPGGRIEVEAKESNGLYVLSITDEGKGVEEDQLEQIFEPFYRSPQETSPGVGLGLAIAKTIALSHQATLKVENVPGKGARFSLYLP